jgi:hypothetical protein
VKKSGAYGEAYNPTTVGAVMGTVNAPDEFAQAVAQALPGEEPYDVDIETDEDEKKVTVRTHGHGTTNIRVFRQTDEGLEVDHEYFRMPKNVQGFLGGSSENRRRNSGNVRQRFDAHLISMPPSFAQQFSTMPTTPTAARTVTA